MNTTDRQREQLVRLLKHEGWTWEIDEEIKLLGYDKIIRGLLRDPEILCDAGWDQYVVYDLYDKAKTWIDPEN